MKSEELSLSSGERLRAEISATYPPPNTTPMVLLPPPRSRSLQKDAEAPHVSTPGLARKAAQAWLHPPGGWGGVRAGGQAEEGTPRSITVWSFPK